VRAGRKQNCTLKLEPKYSSETRFHFRKSSRRSVPECGSLHTHALWVGQISNNGTEFVILWVTFWEKMCIEEAITEEDVGRESHGRNGNSSFSGKKGLNFERRP
jgi:hypothetical protein